MEKIVYLEYQEEFESYGLPKSTLIELKEKGIVADIRMPKDKTPKLKADSPTMGVILGQDTSKIDGTEYYTIGQNYIDAVHNSGAKIRFLDYEQPYAQMKKCDGTVLIGGIFDNPEEFYFDGKDLGNKAGKRYFAYHSIIKEAHEHKKPMLGICAGAQMIGAILGNMKLIRSLKDEIPFHAIHKPREKTDTLLHPIKLLKKPIFDIMGVDRKETEVNINSRHLQGMALPAMQDYVKGKAKVKMDLYAISSSDGIPEIWGNAKAGILCVQGHPEDLAVKGDMKMQNIYNYTSNLAKEYKRTHAKLQTQNISVACKSDRARG